MTYSLDNYLVGQQWFTPPLEPYAQRQEHELVV